jgi:hypothetical protein
MMGEVIQPVEFQPDHWPAPMTDNAYYGLAGEIVNTIAPHSEADKNGLLVQLLVAVGNAIGGTPYCLVESNYHCGNLFAVIVGDTAKARKGTSWGWIKRIVAMADNDWRKCIVNGLSSGEGVIYRVRDDEENPDEITKRLMIVEGEFVQALKVADRNGNTLTSVLRSAWDADVLRTLVRNAPMTATGAHISLIGHITQEELLRNFTDVDMANGLGNRFLWVSVKRSKLLPFGDSVGDEVLNPLASQLRDVFTFSRKSGRCTFADQDTRNLWSAYYERWDKQCETGMVGSMTARVEAQTLRLSLLYALLDQTNGITEDHLRAARAVTDYCHRSVQHIFQSVTGNRIADTILKTLAVRPRLNRTEVHNLGGRHWKRHDINDAIEILTCDHGVKFMTEQGIGRPVEWLSLGEAVNQ